MNLHSQLDLSWKSYEFYTSLGHELEQSHAKHLVLVKNFVTKNMNPSQARKLQIRSKVDASFRKLLNVYSKQLDSVSELITLHDSGIDIAIEREVDVELLRNLKNVTSTLIEGLKVHRLEIREVLG